VAGRDCQPGSDAVLELFLRRVGRKDIEILVFIDVLVFLGRRLVRWT
jgi:hypothetical protein